MEENEEEVIEEGAAKDDSPKSEEEKASAVAEYEKLVTAKQALIAEQDKIKKDIVELRKSRRELKSVGTEAADAAKPEPAEKGEDPQDAEGWKKFIDGKASEKASEVSAELKKIKDTQSARAEREFVILHPEYSAENDPSDERFNALREVYSRVKSRPAYDAKDILEDYEDAWAVQNRAEITLKADEARKYKETMESAVRESGTSGGSGGYERQGSSSDTQASAEDHRIAKSINMPIKKYLALKAQQESLEIS